ncbi:hypothetical protein F5Y00DRAFT_224606 [Daldinia vernicosa]|uniref:uncharacterized protein n=1 Tax=Daldinia vernicosa TaxID=114800 RepID=UPI0020072EC9|nr:uncharacterized protein F5Y00DRAFT_224606 [Daldinia vernicosa]KAI0853392.1 hypothetical protein F5Y00DRAFT_224606 [Daldinia vernicosa]
MSSDESLLIAELFNLFIEPSRTNEANRPVLARSVGEWLDDLFDCWYELLFDEDEGEDVSEPMNESTIRYCSAAYIDDEHLRQAQEEAAACDAWFSSPPPSRWFCIMTGSIVLILLYYAPYITDAILVSVAIFSFLLAIASPPVILLVMLFLPLRRWGKANEHGQNRGKTLAVSLRSISYKSPDILNGQMGIVKRK